MASNRANPEEQHTAYSPPSGTSNITTTPYSLDGTTKYNSINVIPFNAFLSQSQSFLLLRAFFSPVWGTSFARWVFHIHRSLQYITLPATVANN